MPHGRVPMCLLQCVGILWLKALRLSYLTNQEHRSSTTPYQSPVLYISGTDNEINAALICLRVTLCVPIPLDSALSALGACVAQIFWDGDVEVNCRRKLVLMIRTPNMRREYTPSSRSGPGFSTGQASHVFNGLPRMTLPTGSITDTF